MDPAGHGTQPVPRVLLAPALRPTAPVACPDSAALAEAVGAAEDAAAPSLALEREVLAASEHAPAGQNDYVRALVEYRARGVTDGDVQRVVAAGGGTPHSAAVALAMLGDAGGNDAKLAAFAMGVQSLEAMGIPLPLAAGALAAHDGAVELAAEAATAV